MPDTIESTIEYLKGDSVSPEDAIRCLEHEAALVRVNAVDALGRLATRHDHLVDQLVAAIRDPRNRTVLMGTVTVSHVAVANLVRVGTERARSAAAQVLGEWTGDDRDDLLWHLRSEGLSIPAEERQS